jgi:hypothetical protein
LEAKAPETVVRQVCAHLNLTPKEIIWFEHGPIDTGTKVGCGLDYAHIHILIRPPFTFEEFAATARSQSHLDWQGSTAENGYSALVEGRSYLIAGSADSVIVAQDVENVGSQFFRRVVTSLQRRTTGWDYRTHPHSENIAKTISMFKSLESAASSEG